MDRLSAMHIFVRIVQQGSFSAVADEMRLSQSSVSKKVSALEDYIGSRLINRSSRQLVLTEVGANYYEQCLGILENVDKAETQAKEFTSDPAGSLKVTLPTTFGSLHVVPFLGAFMNQYPKIKVDLKLLDHRVDLVAEGIDLALRIGELQDSSMVATPLGHSRRTVVASQAYLKQHGAPKHPNELVNHNCLVYSLLSKVNNWQFQEQGKDFLVQVQGDFQANNGDVVQQMALQDRGIAFLPRWLIKQELQAGRLTEILAEFSPTPMPIYALYPKDRYMPLKVRFFIDFLKQQLEKAAILQN